METCPCRTFKEIALAEGSKSQEVKKRLITKLLVSSAANEPGYIMRALQVLLLYCSCHCCSKKTTIELATRQWGGGKVPHVQGLATYASLLQSMPVCLCVYTCTHTQSMNTLTQAG